MYSGKVKTVGHCEIEYGRLCCTGTFFLVTTAKRRTSMQIATCRFVRSVRSLVIGKMGHAPKLCTLVLPNRGRQYLLGLKKRGFGEGKYNGFGGKVEQGETIRQAAIRELQEEVDRAKTVPSIIF